MARLTPRHQAIARAVVRGAKNADICEAYGITQQGLRRLMKQELFKIELRRLQANFEAASADIETRLLSLGHRALDIIERSVGEDQELEDGFAPLSDFKEQRQDAWEVLKMIRANTGTEGGPNFQFNFHQVIADNRTRSVEDLSDAITARIREAKERRK